MLIKDLRIKKDDIRFCQERRTKEKLRVFHKEENLRPLYSALKCSLDRVTMNSLVIRLNFSCRETCNAFSSTCL